jgi:hypothetical protein
LRLSRHQSRRPAPCPRPLRYSAKPFRASWIRLCRSANSASKNATNHLGAFLRPLHQSFFVSAFAFPPPKPEQNPGQGFWIRLRHDPAGGARSATKINFTLARCIVYRKIRSAREGALIRGILPKRKGRDHSLLESQFRSRARCSRSREGEFFRAEATPGPNLPLRFGHHRAH